MSYLMNDILEIYWLGIRKDYIHRYDMNQPD